MMTMPHRKTDTTSDVTTCTEAVMVGKHSHLKEYHCHSSSSSSTSSSLSPTSRKNDHADDASIISTKSTSSNTTTTTPFVPHRGSLRRIQCDTTTPSSYSSSPYIYIVEVNLPKPSRSGDTPKETMELRFERFHYEHICRLFSIIDTENQGLISDKQVREFVALRCPVFRRRDEALRRMEFTTTRGSPKESKGSHKSRGKSKKNPLVQNWMSFHGPGRRRTESNHPPRSAESVPRNGSECCNKPTAPSTFDEVWNAVVTSAEQPPVSSSTTLLGIEAFLVFCRLIALAQYQEAKQRFSQRHLQQTLRHQSSGNEVIMVEVPPPAPPSPLSLPTLKQFQNSDGHSSRTLPLPELDLNHCLVAAHDDCFGKIHRNAHVTISVFGTAVSETEFKISFTSDDNATTVAVRRTLSDLIWLQETFASHQTLGGTLCGRILPPFPKRDEKRLGVLSSLTKGFWRGGGGGGDAVKKDRAKKEEEKGRRLERCLNYLLEHPALKTSFVLNAVLKASQSGLDAAKRTLEEEMTPYPSQSRFPPMDDKSEFSSFFCPNSLSSSSSDTSSNPNLSWVRTAAQAAMALKLHGILDATGYASASARLQHASLPNFDVKSWQESASPPPSLESSCLSVDKTTETDPEEVCFETGVVAVESELEEDLAGYDLLPSPKKVETKFHYGLNTLDDSVEGVTAVDEDIDKLREIIGAMDNTLGRCLAASTVIADAKRERDALHLEIVKGLDSWGKGELGAERALLEGVARLEENKNIVEKSNGDLNDALSWQSSLATSAVSAAEDVRSAVRASRTASGAKAAAESAFLTAKKICNTNRFSDPDEHRAAQTRASISHSHAIHAAVIEHEAFAAKRKAALALAHDVKCWNGHRKREMLNTCFEAAKTQREAAKDAVEAWSVLLEGLHLPTAVFAERDEAEEFIVETGLVVAEEEFTSSIDPDIVDDSDSPSSSGGPRIVPVDHMALNPEHLKHPDALLPNHFKDAQHQPMTRSYPPLRTSSDTNPKESSNRSPETNLSASETPSNENDVMTASMQSLVDGLMNWGGRYDPQDDMTLPTGMAVSIALEESGVLGASSTSSSSRNTPITSNP